MTASLHVFKIPFLAISSKNKRFAELGAGTLQQCSGNNRTKLCRQGFSTTSDEPLLCSGSLYYNYDITPLRNCQVECFAPRRTAIISSRGWHVSRNLAKTDTPDQKRQHCAWSFNFLDYLLSLCDASESH